MPPKTGVGNPLNLPRSTQENHLDVKEVKTNSKSHNNKNDLINRFPS